MSQDIADAVNVLGAFCGQRDVQQLTHEHLEQAGYSKQADVLVLYGGSILCGVDVLAEAMRAGAARRYVISGGAGHTTEALRSQVKRAFPGIDVAGKSEAELFDACLRERYGLHADYLECASTNLSVLHGYIAACRVGGTIARLLTAVLLREQSRLLGASRYNRVKPKVFDLRGS